jgi:hypothetical protein
MSKRGKSSPYFCWGSKAKDFFAHPYFYGDLPDFAHFCAGKREETFAEQSVFEVMKNLKTNVQVTEFFMAVGAQGSRVSGTLKDFTPNCRPNSLRKRKLGVDVRTGHQRKRMYLLLILKQKMRKRRWIKHSSSFGVPIPLFQYFVHGKRLCKVDRRHSS